MWTKDNLAAADRRDVPLFISNRVDADPSLTAATRVADLKA